MADGNDWDADAYDEQYEFVFEHGDALLHLLDATADERILDLGCGTGHLTADISDSGATVVGLDGSPEMVSKARAVYPTVEFRTGDARSFEVDEPFDAVFSNAALHWIPEEDQEELLESVADALVPGGRFVAEMGGTGNVAAIVDATRAELADRGYDVASPWYFPSVGEYASRLEAEGFEVRYATLFDRATTLEGADGLRNWLTGFGGSFFESVPTDEREDVVAAVEDRLRPELFDGENWTAGYRRLRFAAHLVE
ncbi:methyltransferase domain-containing protein [Haloarculaceae archaeon H-GB2-1]|nr:methyltransferase domain-containing protein [Haloarculaceae archaeon H-GB1-1]MEA5388819.1 methyltransferase domain-containing protein [Haloarculaceae archaeon H-GB11]MEA5406876.1 methyltransferase domain-containing protein [Haloarculaceae archaeon H-GB2-1]